MSRTRSAIAATIVCLLLIGLALCGPGDASAGGGPYTEIVSVDSIECPSNGSSDLCSVSTDGRYVAFDSVATFLVGGDTNGLRDVFVRDRLLGTTERVSISNTEAQAVGYSDRPSISADGRYVAFQSTAANLVTGDTNGVRDVFVRDRVLGTTIRVSRSTGGTQGNYLSQAASISADGRYVSFQSFATNLVAGDTNGHVDIFVRDTLLNTTTRASVGNLGAQGNMDSMWSSISADGRYVAFQSDAGNLVTGDTNGVADVFVRDLVGATTTRVSVATGGAQADSGSYNPSISADGHYVAFQSDAGNLVTGDTLGFEDIFVRDTWLNTTERVSVSSAEAQGNQGSYFPSISANGRYIAFSSLASNLVTGDTNGVWDVFVRDREAGTTERVSVSTAGTQGNSWSDIGWISADGRRVAFRSQAINLVTNDPNGFVDVFMRWNYSTIAYTSMRGVDRYDTAIKISQAMFPNPLPPGSGMVLAPGDVYQPALCGAPLASAYGGPVLLTPPGVLPTNVKNEILRLNPDSVTLINLDLWMQEEIDTLLGTIGAAKMIRGSTYYEMSYKVAVALDAVTGGLDSATAIIVPGNNFPDAIGVAPLACTKQWPILLTHSPTGALNTYATQALNELDIPQALKVGTYATLPAGVAGVGNCSGGDRYETNASVAEWSKNVAGLTFNHLGVTTGDKFPDALAAGPYMAQWGGMLMLSPLFGPLSDCTVDEIYANRLAPVNRITYIAMIEPVVSLIKALVP